MPYREILEEPRGKSGRFGNIVLDYRKCRKIA
jgi:hypothetical protein